MMGILGELEILEYMKQALVFGNSLTDLLFSVHLVAPWIELVFCLSDSKDWFVSLLRSIWDLATRVKD